MRISPQCFFILIISLPFTSISAADETLYVSLYYLYGYVWVGPYQGFPVLTRYVIPVSLKTAGPERLMTARPPMTSAAPTGPDTPSTTAPTEAPTTTTTTRRGDN